MAESDNIIVRGTALYRHFDAAGRLLYVGITADPLRRTAAHMDRSRWAGMVATITVVWFPSRGAAVDAEEHAIATEHPVYNIASRPPAPPINVAAEMEKLEAYIARYAPKPRVRDELCQ